jgi:hypothetical protein
MKSRVPGEAILGWLPAIACALIVLNDFGLRRWHPGFVSGKLSDIAICFLFPIVLFSLWEWIAFLGSCVLRKTWKPGGRSVRFFAGAFAGAYYSAMEIVPGFGDLHRRVLSTLLPFYRFRAGTADLTDLFALLMIPLSLIYLRRHDT